MIMRFQSGIQITLLVVAVIIAFSVIKPKIDSISEDQSQVDSYRTAIQNIGLYNQRLQALINQAANLSAYDRSVLLRYLPYEVDSTKVASDIANIISQNNLLLLDITPDDPYPVTAETLSPVDQTAAYEVPTEPTVGVVVDDPGNVPKNTIMAQQFIVEVVGTYEQMKSMMKDFERNAYPLRLVEFSFDLEEENSNLIQYTLLLETYALPSS